MNLDAHKTTYRPIESFISGLFPACAEMQINAPPATYLNPGQPLVSESYSAALKNHRT
jgi:hypothetical protein